MLSSPRLSGWTLCLPQSALCVPSVLLLQVGRVDRHVLQECYDQYCYMQHGLRYGPQEIDDLTCAACQDTPHSLHNDALMKGYTWQYRDGQPKQPWRVSGYGNRLFLSDNVILQHMEAVEVARNPHRHQAADVSITCMHLQHSL